MSFSRNAEQILNVRETVPIVNVGLHLKLCNQSHNDWYTLIEWLFPKIQFGINASLETKLIHCS